MGTEEDTFSEEINNQREDLALRIKSTEETINKFSEQLRQMRIQEVFLAGKAEMCKAIFETKDGDKE